MARQITRHQAQEVAAPTAGRLAPLQQSDALTLNRMAVAKQFPRDDEQIRRKLKGLAAGKSEEWGYAWPVKNKRTQKTEMIDGPSIKCANAVLAACGNIDVKVHIEDAPNGWHIHVGLLDLETNGFLERVYHQRKSQNIGSGYDDDGRRDDMLLAMGQSKAIRNAVCNYLAEHVDFAYEESKKVLLGTIKKDEPRYRERIVQRLSTLNVDPQRVVQWIGRGVKAWSVEDLARIVGVLGAIDQGVMTVEQLWPDRRPAPKGPAPPRDEPPPVDQVPDGPPEPEHDPETGELPNPGNDV